MYRKLLILFLKVIVSVFAAILSALTFSSCNVSHRIDAVGHTVITTSDTTVVKHSGFIYFPKK